MGKFVVIFSKIMNANFLTFNNQRRQRLRY